MCYKGSFSISPQIATRLSTLSVVVVVFVWVLVAGLGVLVVVVCGLIGDCVCGCLVCVF